MMNGPIEKGPDLNAAYLRYVAAQPGPKIAVGQDLDNPPGLGAQFGEVNATIHKIDEHVAVDAVPRLKNIYRRTMERLLASETPS